MNDARNKRFICAIGTAMKGLRVIKRATWWNDAGNACDAPPRRVAINRRWLTRRPASSCRCIYDDKEQLVSYYFLHKWLPCFHLCIVHSFFNFNILLLMLKRTHLNATSLPPPPHPSIFWRLFSNSFLLFLLQLHQPFLEELWADDTVEQHSP